MLVLGRRVHEKIVLDTSDGQITLSWDKIRAKGKGEDREQVIFVLDVPDEVEVYREEVYEKYKDQPKRYREHKENKK